MDRLPRAADTRATPKDILLNAWRNRISTDGPEILHPKPLTEAQAPLQKQWEQEANQVLLRDTLTGLRKLAGELDEDQWRYEAASF